MATNRLGAAALAAAGLHLAIHANGHCVQHCPISRQHSKSRIFLDTTDEDYEPSPYSFHSQGVALVMERGRAEIDPEVLEATGGGGVYPLYFMPRADNGNFLETNEVNKRARPCGDPDSEARFGGRERYTTPNSEWEVLHTYSSGQEIEIGVTIFVYHYGHFEFFLCDIRDLEDPDGIVDQECFNQYPLTRAYNANDASAIDPNFPGRYYTDPPCRIDEVAQGTVAKDLGWTNDPYTDVPSYEIKMRYQLPDIECPHCVLQMRHHTAHLCKHIGYDDFNPSSWNSDCAPDTEDWIHTSEEEKYSKICGEEGSRYPEEFWQCSDIALTRSELPEGSPTYEHLGCFRDEEDRALVRGFWSRRAMTLEMCAQYCSELGFKYMGLQFGRECDCGSEGDEDTHQQYGSGTCNMDCTGASDESCGGRWSFDLYSVTRNSTYTNSC